MRFEGEIKDLPGFILNDKKSISINGNFESTYIKLDLNNLKSYNVKFDILFSMEVIYYLNNPYQTISYIFSHLLKSGGCCVIGLDHYFENSSSLSWPNKLDVVMSTYSISKWKKI